MQRIHLGMWGLMIFFGFTGSGCLEGTKGRTRWKSQASPAKRVQERTRWEPRESLAHQVREALDARPADDVSPLPSEWQIFVKDKETYVLQNISLGPVFVVLDHGERRSADEKIRALLHIQHAFPVVYFLATAEVRPDVHPDLARVKTRDFNYLSIPVFAEVSRDGKHVVFFGWHIIKKGENIRKDLQISFDLFVWAVEEGVKEANLDKVVER